MHRSHAPLIGANHPPSPSGAPARRAPHWPVRIGVVAVAALALAAPMAAAEPAAPVRPPSIAEAVPATPVDRPVQAGDGFKTLGEQAFVSAMTAPPQVKAPAPPPPPPTTAAPAPPAPPPTTAAPPPPPPTTAAPAPPPPPPTTAAPAPAPTPAPAPAPVASGTVWDRLAQCEAGGNWAANTGNGYYGGLQFSASSWAAMGGGGLPHQASRATQIAMGEKLLAAQGWGAWPSCSAKLGLR